MDTKRNMITSIKINVTIYISTSITVNAMNNNNNNDNDKAANTIMSTEPTYISSHSQPCVLA